MKHVYLTNYIQQKIKDPVLAEALRFELDRRIFHYGDHFKDSVELSSEKRSLKKWMKKCLFFLKVFSDCLKSKKLNGAVVSGAYVSASSTIKSSKIDLIAPPWMPSIHQPYFAGLSLFKKVSAMSESLQKKNYSFFLTTEFLSDFQKMKEELRQFYAVPGIKAVLLSNDVGFFEVLSLNLFKDLKKKSFLYIHGIPGYYSKNMYAKSDYLLVWGEALKKHFVAAGFSSDKIKVVGHPHFRPTGKMIKSSLDNVLVLGSSVPGSQLDEDKVMLWDRGNIILYCYLIQDVLTSLGVKRATLRPHPSENREWYKKHIDLNFYQLDEAPSLSESFQKSSLVIGPTSSSAIESLNAGINYITFEPFYNDESYLHYKLVPPFDKSDSRLLIATNTSELADILRNNLICDQSIVEDYLSSEYSLEETISEIIGGNFE